MFVPLLLLAVGLSFLNRENALWPRRLATVYSSVGDGSRFERAPDPGHIGQGHYVNGPRKAFSAGAGVLSTATDYATFLQMMLNGGELDGTRICRARRSSR